MTRVNLRDLYPHYKGDAFVEIPDNVLEVIEDCERKEKAYKRYLRYYNVFSLDDNNQLKAEYQNVSASLSPHETYEKKAMAAFLHRAMEQLSETQAKRIYVHFFLGLNYAEIAKAENVDESAVRASIGRGLRKMRKFLNGFF